MAAEERNYRRVVRIARSASEVHQRLREKYGVADNELFERDIRQAYQKGLHHAISDQVLAYLERKHGTQVRIATALGVERSSVSKMKQSRSVPGRYVELVLASNGFAIKSEPAQQAGLIEAAYFVRSKVMRDSSCQRPMSEADFTEVACGELTEWYDAFVLALMEVEDYLRG
jgi:hypothetical protein